MRASMISRPASATLDWISSRMRAATTSLDRVPAAIVNLDEPATVTDANGKKQTVPLGRVVTGELVGNDSSSNLDWSLTDAQKAQEGLEDGTYYAVLTIPKTFSAAATSSSSAPARLSSVVMSRFPP